jgi:hypothetical protein
MRLVRSCGRVKEDEGAGRSGKESRPDRSGGREKFRERRKQNVGELRFFYCLPIGTVAFSVWVPHRRDTYAAGCATFARTARRTEESDGR